MPKLKTHRGAAKRFRKTGGGAGAFKCRRANRNHILTKQSTKKKRHSRVSGGVIKLSDQKAVKRMLAGS